MMMLNTSHSACACVSVRPAAPKRSLVCVRASGANGQQRDTPKESALSNAILPDPIPTAPAPAQSAQSVIPAPSNTATAPLFLGPWQEAINGRAAMLGFVAAVIAELATNQGIVSQLAGRYENQELVEKAVGGADLAFGAVVVLVAVATVMPKLIDGVDVNARSFGPFTPALESTVGRVAMMGFAGLLVVELVKGSAVF